MSAGIQSLWIILTVVVPGIVFYGTFRLLVGIFFIDIPFLYVIDNSQILNFCIIVTTMIFIQVIGIGLETAAFCTGFYKGKNRKCIYAFARRYEIIAKNGNGENNHLERIVGQFFMSHNIAVGVIVNFLWFVIYEFFSLKVFTLSSILTSIILLMFVMLSIYVAKNRFSQSCKVLSEFVGRKDYM